MFEKLFGGKVNGCSLAAWLLNDSMGRLALVASSYPPIYGAIDSFRRLIITPILVLSAIKASSCHAAQEQGAVGLQWGNNWAIYILKRRRKRREGDWNQRADHLPSYGNSRESTSGGEWRQALHCPSSSQIQHWKKVSLAEKLQTDETHQDENHVLDVDVWSPRLMPTSADCFIDKQFCASQFNLDCRLVAPRRRRSITNWNGTGRLSHCRSRRGGAVWKKSLNSEHHR